MTDNIVLSYKESLLRTSDVELLKGPFWLNDTIISFYFEYLESDLFKGCSHLLFVSPEVTQCIKVSPQSEIKVFLEPLIDSIQRDFIFFALNDNEMTDSSGGSHWSLLVFSRPERVIFHYDSSQGCNYSQALDLGEKILKYFSLPIQEKVHNVPCLQQTNGYDCGVHLLCNAEQLASYAGHYGRLTGCPKLTHEKVNSMRWEILDIIDRLRDYGRVN
ncbi:sentrin-specific protease 8-like [Diabrotica virgifera virgifera]|uniref:Sentrin-specific protease 8 n=1 Tax=Diabrotica virgifera virgifera TaxID=50390 RepID=A0A6P7GQR5_DIAVI|nr:sentrin-specific protease 8-like [Diabrotica virgifera virgifera]